MKEAPETLSLCELHGAGVAVLDPVLPPALPPPLTGPKAKVKATVMKANFELICRCITDERAYVLCDVTF